jgi:hypothetical protein
MKNEKTSFRIGMKDRSTDLLMENGVYSPILHPRLIPPTHHQRNKSWVKFVHTKPYANDSNRTYRINHKVQCTSGWWIFCLPFPFQWSWLILKCSAPIGNRWGWESCPPLDRTYPWLSNCFVGIKDRSTDLLMENGVYSPILHPRLIPPYPPLTK